MLFNVGSLYTPDMPPRHVKRKFIVKKPSKPVKAVPPAKTKPVQKKQSVIEKAIPNKIKFVTVPNVPEKLASVPTPGKVAVAKPALIQGETFEQKLRRMQVDPEELLAFVITGDVVSLGLMSQEELDQDAIYNGDGICVKQSGREKAREILDSKIRAKAIVDALPYLRSKKNDGVKKDEEEVEAAILYIPDNGRMKT